MFKLLRYFSITSALVLVAVTAFLVIAYRHLAVQQVIDQGETANMAMAQMISSMFWPQFADHLARTSAAGLTSEELRAHPETARLRRAILTHNRGLSTVRIKIINLDGLEILSTDATGKMEWHGDRAGFLSARAGRVASELVNRDTYKRFDQTEMMGLKYIWATLGKALMAVESRDVLESYIPIRGSDGEIESVIEIYDDLSPIIENVKSTQKVVMITIISASIFLYVILFLIARRAGNIIANQHEEILSANKELEAFAYVASHDLQEPLRMVASYCDLLKRRYGNKLDSDADEFIGFAIDGARRMQALIDDLLSYSRLGTRGKAFERTECQEALDRALANLEAAIAESGAVVTHDRLPTVEGDGDQIAQVFQNLISNAIKFRTDKVPRIHVSARMKAPNWLVSVSDNGCGIESQYAERIFVIFQRLHSRREYPGTGIGLAICKKVVERHGGRIWMESEPGAGSTFHFTLPTQEKLAA